jgi:hypothetical protein
MSTHFFLGHFFYKIGDQNKKNSPGIPWYQWALLKFLIQFDY